MKRRCNVKTDRGYRWYGARGITYSKEWKSFKGFEKDMFDSYNEHVKNFGEKQTTLDRFPDKDGNYMKENCRWATRKEQGGNIRSNRVITFNGETMILQDWANRLGISHSSLIERLDKYPLEKALTTPKWGNKVGLPF